MNLTSAQKTTVLNWIAANDPTGTDDQIAALLNAQQSPSYFIWKSNADRGVIDSQINKAAYTPTDAPPTSPSTDLTYSNRAFLAQLKQFNAQWLTLPTTALDCRGNQVRQNFKDCLTAIPTGASGNNLDAGWGSASVGAVRAVLMRTVTVFEGLFVTSPGTGPGNVTTDPRGAQTNPDVPGIDASGATIEGAITAQNVSDIRGGI